MRMNEFDVKGYIPIQKVNYTSIRHLISGNFSGVFAFFGYNLINPSKSSFGGSLRLLIISIKGGYSSLMRS